MATPPRGLGCSDCPGLDVEAGRGGIFCGFMFS